MIRKSWLKKISGLMIVLTWVLPASAGIATKMKIITAPQSLAIGACSTVVQVQPQDNAGYAATVPVRTQVFLGVGGTADLRYFSDSNCSNRVTSIYLAAGSNLVSFFFKDNVAGVKTLVVSTNKYIDDQQIEKIGSTVVVAPAPIITSFSASPSSIIVGQTSTLNFTTSNAISLKLDPGQIDVTGRTSYVVTPLATTTYTLTASNSSGVVYRSVAVLVTSSSSTNIGRPIPSPIYGVTVDDISNIAGIVSSLKAIVKFPTTRIVFDGQNGPTYYANAIQQMRPSSYIMGQLLDSTDMAITTVAAYKTRTETYVKTLGSQVDVWEIGNEINGNWLGANTVLTGDKVRTAYDVVHASNAATALTFFWEGNPGETGNCVDGPGFDMFGWIKNFLANPENARVANGLDYVFISWYPQQCNNIKPNWTKIFNDLNIYFPNAKVGFGEIGTADPQFGSTYEINLINEFYPMGKTNTALPANYVGGYFWWYFYEEMIPSTTTLMKTLNNAILQGP